MRALLSLGWASRAIRPRDASRSTAVVIAPLVSWTRANRTYGLRSFVEKHLHDREVGEAHLGRLDAAGRQALERPMRLHQHQPQVRAGAVGRLLPRCLALHPGSILTSRYLMSSNRCETEAVHSG